METPYSFVHVVKNLGEVLVTHTKRDEKTKNDVMEISRDEKILATIHVPFDTKPVNAMILIDNAVNALEYNG